MSTLAEQRYIETEQEIDVLRAEYISDYKISIYFSDYSERIVDFEPFLRTSNHPDYDIYMKDIQKFKEFSIIDGNLNWHDYTMIFPVEQLHKGYIDIRS